MGVVYKARDTRLDRPVAVKVLPHDRVADPERKRRFIQEAKAASALNHPNIITIHDIGQAESIDFIAMEYVDGRTLDDMIGRKGLRLGEALKYAIQIADALTAAHAAGIIHRDLKPGNVMVTAKGQIKVLDFGLAKLMEALPGGIADPTLTLKPATEEGKIVGTIAYMSPEQAEGKKVDTRSDIFSFGSVLYEMVTGRRAFPGESSASTMAAILKDNPTPAGQMVDGLPREVERLINRCLRKDAGRRYQHMDDVKMSLEELKEESDSGALAAAAPAQTKRGRYPKIAAVAVISVSLAAVIWLWLGRSHRKAPETPMTTVPLVTYTGEWDLAFAPLFSPVQQPSFSPDGNEIAFAWNRGQEGSYDIYRKMIGPGEPLRLTTDPAADRHPAWSPDGRIVAFLRALESGKYAVYLVPALGGPERRLTEVESGGTLNWSPDNKWLVISDGEPLGLHLVSVETGEKSRLTHPSRGNDLYASFSPDGRTLAFVRLFDLGSSDVYRVSLTADLQPAGEPERLTYENRDIQSPVWTRAGKELLYSDGTWWCSGRAVRRLDLSALKGPAGYPTAQEPFGEDATDLAVSPAGRRLVYTRSFVDANIYRFELLDKNGRVGSPRNFIASTRDDSGPAYSPDGRSIVFFSTRSGTQEIWLCNADGSNPRQLTSMGGPLTGDPSWSPDGQTIVFDSRKEGNSDLYLISPQGGAVRRLTSGPGYEYSARWSRDGKWIYFYSDRSGRDQIYKIPAGGGEAVQVTKNGGLDAFESPDGQWIYFSKGSEIDASLWRMSVRGEEEKQIESVLLSFSRNFVVVDDGIYFTKKAGGTLEFLDFKSGKSRTIARIDKLWLLGLAISPDHRWILCSILDQTLNDLMLIENFR
ncbi:MAG: serine/threonine-protein kinase [Candidatus Aminicenantes bacterium]|nr:serine/threonine-protein kinase [Candidatus Aminicenantes bacterium]